VAQRRTDQACGATSGRWPRYGAPVPNLASAALSGRSTRAVQLLAGSKGATGKKGRAGADSTAQSLALLQVGRPNPENGPPDSKAALPRPAGSAPRATDRRLTKARALSLTRAHTHVHERARIRPRTSSSVRNWPMRTRASRSSRRTTPSSARATCEGNSGALSVVASQPLRPPRRRRGRVPAPTWPSPDADVAESM
jgi:hypothetical protein